MSAEIAAAIRAIDAAEETRHFAILDARKMLDGDSVDWDDVLSAKWRRGFLAGHASRQPELDALTRERDALRAELASNSITHLAQESQMQDTIAGLRAELATANETLAAEKYHTAQLREQCEANAAEEADNQRYVLQLERELATLKAHTQQMSEDALKAKALQPLVREKVREAVHLHFRAVYPLAFGVNQGNAVRCVDAITDAVLSFGVPAPTAAEHVTVGHAVLGSDGYEDRVFLASKWIGGLAETKQQADATFNFRKCGTVHELLIAPAPEGA